MKMKAIEIKLSEDEKTIEKVQLLRAGKFQYYDGSALEISADMLKTMKKNFDDNVRKVDCAIDYSHNSYAEAAGWIKEVTLENNDSELWVSVDWTESAREKILEKEYRYLSADFDMNYKDNETGKEYGVVLNGGGLTNRPFLKGMSAILSEISALIDKSPEKLDDIRKILSDDTKKESKDMTTDFSEIKKSLVSVQLSEEQKKEIGQLIGLQNETVKLSEEIKTLKDTAAVKDAENKKLSEELATLKKEAEFNVLLSEGKAVPAQKDAYMLGDMAAFVKNAVVINTTPKGSGDNKTFHDDVKTADQAYDRVVQLSEEKRKLNPQLSEAEARKAVLDENPALKDLL